MKLKRLAKNWDGWARSDPMWSIISRKDKKNNKWDKKEFFAYGRAEISQAIEKINQYSPLEFNSALDFGCGIGRLTQALCEKFHAVIGVDISSDMISLAQELNKFGDRCTYIENRSTEIEMVSDESQDFVYSRITLQHIKPVYAKKYIHSLCNKLKRGGVILFSMPDSAPWYNRLLNFGGNQILLNILRRIYFKSSFVMEMYWIPKKEIEQILIHADCEILYIEREHAVGKHWQSYFYAAKKR